METKLLNALYYLASKLHEEANKAMEDGNNYADLELKFGNFGRSAGLDHAAILLEDLLNQVETSKL